jgi:hypothetical protein
MAEEWLRKTTRPVKMAQVDTTAPNVARVWNYLIGGRDNFEVDLRTARQLIAASPVMAQVGPVTRAFHGRVVRFLAEAGIRQFLDIGTGLPTAGNTHDIAQDVAPQSRIVYVDNDPIVLTHARALLTSHPKGATSYIEADAREPQTIIEEARLALDHGDGGRDRADTAGRHGPRQLLRGHAARERPRPHPGGSRAALEPDGAHADYAAIPRGGGGVGGRA